MYSSATQNRNLLKFWIWAFIREDVIFSTLNMIISTNISDVIKDDTTEWITWCPFKGDAVESLNVHLRIFPGKWSNLVEIYVCTDVWKSQVVIIKRRFQCKLTPPVIAVLCLPQTTGVQVEIGIACGRCMKESSVDFKKKMRCQFQITLPVKTALYLPQTTGGQIAIGTA